MSTQTVHFATLPNTNPITSVTAGENSPQPQPVTQSTPKKLGRPRKNMSTTQTTPEGNTQTTSTKEDNRPITQKTVFDLKLFDDVLLKKRYDAPVPPTSIEEALAMLGNDQKALLKVITDGLASHARETAYNDPTGWMTTDDSGDLTNEPYTGKYADEDAGKKINAVVMSLAKMRGFEKSLPPAEKNKIKDQVKQNLRDNPIFLGDLIK